MEPIPPSAPVSTPEDVPASRLPRLVRLVIPPLLLIAIGLILTGYLWGRVGDLLTDFGREIYGAWALAGGKVLYRDVSYMQGPLSPYVNAMWWVLLGGTERSVIYGNLLLAALTGALFYRLLTRISDVYAATTGTILFFVAGLFGVQTRLTNYNFLTPYAHGLTHGLLLSLLALHASLALNRTGQARYAALAGLLTGLSLLTKMEVFVATMAMTLATAAPALLAARGRQRLRMALALLLALPIAPVIALALLGTAMPLPVAWDAMLGGWRHATRPYILATDFYKENLGLEFPRRNAWKVVRYACLYVQFLAALSLAAIVLGRWLTRRPLLGWLVSLAVAAALLALTQWYPYRTKFWQDVGRGLPLFPLVGMAAAAAMLWRGRSSPSWQRGVAALGCSVLAGALLLKLGLNARLFHYGFVLATPAAALGAVIATGWLPELVRRVGGCDRLVRLGGTALVAGVILWQLHVMRRVLSERTVPVQTPGQMFRLTPRHLSVSQAMDALRAMAAPGDTLAVFPDGAGINYALGMENPTPYDVAHPIALAMFGEQRVTDAYAAHPPTFILRLHQDTGTLGASWFGRDYATGLATQITRDYDVVARFGMQSSGQMQVTLYRQRPPRDSARGP